MAQISGLFCHRPVCTAPIASLTCSQNTDALRTWENSTGSRKIGSSTILEARRSIHRDVKRRSANRGMYYFSRFCKVKSISANNEVSDVAAVNKSQKFITNIEQFLADIEKSSKGVAGYDFSLEKNTLRDIRRYKQKLATEEARQAERMIDWNELDVANGVPGAKTLSPKQQEKLRDRARLMESELKKLLQK